jgi:hypothetical protein
MSVRTASPNDATIVAALLADFLSESLPGHLGTSAAVLERDVLSGAGGLRVLLAERDDVPRRRTETSCEP